MTQPLTRFSFIIVYVCASYDAKSIVCDSVSSLDLPFYKVHHKTTDTSPYSSWYYEYEAKNLPACTLNIHAMLHIPQYIRQCGPAWTTWAFPMERYCGKLSSHVTSRLHPYATLAMCMKCATQLPQLKSKYGRVWDHLSSKRIEGALTTTETRYPECEFIVLLL